MVDRGGHHHCWKLEKVSCLRAVLGPNGGGLVRVTIIGVSEPMAAGVFSGGPQKELPTHLPRADSAAAPNALGNESTGPVSPLFGERGT